MGCPKVQITHLPFVDPPAPVSGGRIHTAAGELAQIVSNRVIRHLAYLEFNPDGEPRGNHFHRKKHEYHYMIQGSVEVTVVDLETQEREVFAMRPGDLIYMPPNHAHAYKALTYTQFIEFAPEAFDPGDIIKYQV